jgi:hypothetical protein
MARVMGGPDVEKERAHFNCGVEVTESSTNKQHHHLQIPKARRPAMFSQLVFISQILKLVPINTPPSEMKQTKLISEWQSPVPYLKTIDAPLCRYALPTKADDFVNVRMSVNKLPRLQDLAEAEHFWSQ